MWSHSVGFQWEAGDMLIMDNIAVAHARLDFEGDRRMWVSMTMD
jgi:alpha-ketoglutarate-dependent taurine dioxygenase